VNISLTTLNEDLRLKLEPRTVTGKGRLKVIESLAIRNIPVRVMVAPIIPGLNSDEILKIIKAAADVGVNDASFTIVRLNGAVADLFKYWIEKAYPDKAQKVIHLIEACHQGKLNDSRFGKRISGDGKEAEAIHQLFKLSVNKCIKTKGMRPYKLNHFTKSNHQFSLF
nr:radical SAM protein [Pseudopedobacter sp.]